MGQESLYHKLPDTHTYTIISLVINGVLRYHVRGRYLDDLISLEDKDTSTNKVIIYVFLVRYRFNPMYTTFLHVKNLARSITINANYWTHMEYILFSKSFLDCN